jgi:hypothetical protein
MYCGKCNNDLKDCTCEDIDERLKDLQGVLVYRMCAVCGKHYVRCKCENPKWISSDPSVPLPKEFK